MKKFFKQLMKKTFLFANLSFSSFAFSDPLGQTQDLLKDPQKRNAFIQQDTQANEVNKKVNQVAGSPEVSNQIYNLSADVFAEIHKITGGDPEKMNKLLQDAAKDPSVLGNALSEDQRKKLKEIATQIETANQKRP
jgi:hypothetical protein